MSALFWQVISACGPKRTSATAFDMSASGQKETNCAAAKSDLFENLVAAWPEYMARQFSQQQTKCNTRERRLFDHPVSERKERFGDSQPERLGRLDVDH